MSLTMKAHGGYDAPWFVVPDMPAAEQKQYLIDAFGLDAAEHEGLTLVETFVTAERLFAAAVGAAKDLGAKPVPKEAVVAEATAKRAPAKRTPAKKAAAPAAPAAEDGVQVQEDEEPAHPHQGVLDAIEAATSKKDLQKLFVDNRDAFADKTVADAAATRMKAVA